MSGVKGLLSQLFKPKKPIDTTPLSPPPSPPPEQPESLYAELEKNKMPPKSSQSPLKQYPVYERLYG